MAIGMADRGPEVAATLRGLLPNRQVELGHSCPGMRRSVIRAQERHSLWGPGWGGGPCLVW